MLPLLLGGLAAGFVYTLVAIGLWVVWRYAGVANFAHSEVAMAAAFTAHFAVPRVGWPLAVVAAVVVAVVLSAALAGLAGRGGQQSIAVTFGALLAFRGIAGLIWGDEPVRWTGAWQLPLGDWVPAGLTWLFIGVAVLAMVAVAGLGLWLQRSATGVRLRAAASAPHLAELTGVRPGRARVAAWLIGGLLAVPAGIAAGMTGLLEPGFMADWTLPAFVLVLLVPGLRPWALLPVGLSVGLIEQLLGRYTPPGGRDVLLFVLLAIAVRWRARATGEPV